MDESKRDEARAEETPNEKLAGAGTPAGRDDPPEAGDRADAPDAGSRADLPEVGDAPETTMALLRVLRPDRAEELARQLKRYIELLLEWNTRFNLTGDRDPATQWSTHVNDALQCAALIERQPGAAPKPGRPIADLGTGGGAPGLLWGLLWPQAQVTMIEATGKKARFLETAARELRLEPERVRVVNARAEQLARESASRESFAWVSARAVGPLARTLEWAMPLVREKGWVFSIKGAAVDEEIAAARDASARSGARFPPDRIPYVRSDGKACTLIACEKVHRPRRGGAGSGRRRAEAPHAKWRKGRG